MNDNREIQKQSDEEKIESLIYTLKPGHTFRSYRDLCGFFGLSVTGGNGKKAQLKILKRFCSIDDTHGNELIITEIYSSPRPKIDEKFLSSKLYPGCSYLLLKHLAEKHIHKENQRHIYLSNKEIMKIICICGSAYSSTSIDELEEISNENSETEFFVRETYTYLIRIIARLLLSLQERGFLSFVKVCMNSSNNLEVTPDEADEIDKCYRTLFDKYGLNSKRSIFFSKYKNEIYKELEEHIGYRSYNRNKFYINSGIVNNINILEKGAGLTDRCYLEINSFICIDIYEKIHKKLLNIRKKEKDMKIKEKNYKNMSFDDYMNEFKEKGVPLTQSTFEKQYNYKQWNFNEEDDVVENRIKRLINEFIRIDFM